LPGRSSCTRRTQGGLRLIALFDSGIGGLTVLGALWRRLPRRDYLYLSGQAHFPYGERDRDDVRRDVAAFADLARREAAEALVIACNTASALALDAAGTAFRGPVHGVIAPVARGIGRPHRIGVLATSNTCRTHAYAWAIHGQVLEVACPELIALAEAGGATDADVAREANAPLAALREAGCDAVVLGCTHLPHFTEVLAGLTESWAQLFDPGEMLAAELARELAPRPEAGRIRCATTGDPSLFATRIARELPELASRAAVCAARRDAAGFLFVDAACGG
jgi:glutamate racemase